MARTTSVSLGDHSSTFISAKVEQGRYGSASDVMRPGLCLLEEHEDKIQALQRALADGEASGDPIPLERDDFLNRMHARHVKDL